jgi:predicted nucleotidyltransferase
MTRERALLIVREHAVELKGTGVASASLFGSMARGESEPGDVDIAVRLDASFSTGGFDYFWQREQLRERLSKLLGCKVDIVEEPVHYKKKSTGTEPLPSEKLARRLLDIIQNGECQRSGR